MNPCELCVHARTRLALVALRHIGLGIIFLFDPAPLRRLMIYRFLFVQPLRTVWPVVVLVVGMVALVGVLRPRRMRVLRPRRMLTAAAYVFSAGVSAFMLTMITAAWLSGPLSASPVLVILLAALVGADLVNAATPVMDEDA